ncbi:MAG: hypothetical protein GY795_09415 [Desulfobacterales bacterium]|nr:hypothetical protein [Desulfobacterales bacterium]
MQVRFVLKSLRSVLTVLSDMIITGLFSKPVIIRKTVCLICLLVMLFFKASQAQAREPANVNNGGDDIAVILTRLLSHKEAERFRVLEKAKERFSSIKTSGIENALVSLQKKNVSTLIFVLTEIRSEAVYNMDSTVQRVLENSEGSFPNIAYYYARVRPRKGLFHLGRLYETHSIQRLFICKAIGETGFSEALDFLMAEAEKQKISGKNIIPHLAGLQCMNKIMNKADISRFLEQELSREEIILLSGLKTDFSQADLISFCKHRKIKNEYAVQYVFRNPGHNFKAFRFIVEKQLNNKQYDKVLQLMMSDGIRRTGDQHVRQYRESVLAKIRNKVTGRKKNPR